MSVAAPTLGSWFGCGTGPFTSGTSTRATSEPWSKRARPRRFASAETENRAPTRTVVIWVGSAVRRVLESGRASTRLLFRQESRTQKLNNGAVTVNRSAPPSVTNSPNIAIDAPRAIMFRQNSCVCVIFCIWSSTLQNL